MFRRRRRSTDDFREEIRAHLQLQTDELKAEGSEETEARSAARKMFGNVTGVEERVYESGRILWLDDLLRDVRYGLRALRKAPGFTIVAVLTLALAIGANTSIFAVVSRVLLNPLPYGSSDRLIALDYGMPSRNISSGISSLPSRLYYYYRDRARTLKGLAFYRADELTLTGEDIPEQIRVCRATPSLAAVLQVSPVQGRWFNDEDGAPGASAVAVLSYGLWVRRYGQDPGIIGRIVTLDSVPTTVTGVMSPSFAFPDPRVDVWIALPLTRASASDAYSFSAVARLRDGATIASARAELNHLDAELAPTYPRGGYGQLRSTATTLIDAVVGRVSNTLWILLASVGVLMLVACGNIGNLFLVRSEARQREVAVRRALGAGNRRIALHFLSESVLLSIAGGAIGLALAWVAVDFLVAYGPTNLPRLKEVHLDGVTLAFTFALSLVTGVAFGSIPLLRLRGLPLSLHESGRGTTASRGRHRTRHLLMGGEIALALVLLVSSGLMLRSFQKLREVDPGFNANSVLTFRIGLPRSEYPDREKIVAAHRAVLARLSVLPGVTVVSASTCLPLEDGCNQTAPLFVEGQVVPPGANPPLVVFRAVAGNYLQAMGMRLLRGRGIDRRDVERDEPIVVINQALAKMAFPNGNAIGRRIRLGNQALSPSDSGWLTVIGIVANTPTRALTEASPVAKLYMPMFASREVEIAPRIAAMSYVIRTAQPQLSLMTAVRRAIGEIYPNLALAQVRTLQDILDRASAQMAFTMVLLLIAASMALILGVIGIYGVTSYIVSQRTGEIGLRLALGAEPRTVVAMIVRQGAVVVIAGIAVGLLSAFACSRLIESLLFGVSPHDFGVFAATTVLLLGIALFACWLPARRAARLNPIEALRAE